MLAAIRRVISASLGLVDCSRDDLLFSGALSRFNRPAQGVCKLRRVFRLRPALGQIPFLGNALLLLLTLHCFYRTHQRGRYLRRSASGSSALRLFHGGSDGVFMLFPPARRGFPRDWVGSGSILLAPGCS